MKKEISCGAVIARQTENGREILLIRHVNGGHWAFPKGHMEGNETESETALREIREETGLTVTLDTGFRAVVTYSPKPGVMKDVIYFAAEYIGGEAHRQVEEVTELCWVPAEDAAAHITFENDNDVLTDSTENLSQVFVITTKERANFYLHALFQTCTAHVRFTAKLLNDLALNGAAECRRIGLIGVDVHSSRILRADTHNNVAENHAALTFLADLNGDDLLVFHTGCRCLFHVEVDVALCCDDALFNDDFACRALQRTSRGALKVAGLTDRCCNTELACVGQCNFNLRLRARRAKDGHNKGTLRADDLYLLVGSVLAGLREFFLNGKLCVCAKKRFQIRFGHVNVTCGGFNHNFHLKIPVLSGFCISILLRIDRKYKFWAMFFLRFMINLMQKRPQFEKTRKAGVKYV